MLRSKNKFFDVFKLWGPRTEICEIELSCLWINSEKKFVSTTFQVFINNERFKSDMLYHIYMKKTG